jgi:tellurium resistance protein TerZ
MDKGAVLDLPQSLAQITVGLGWDVDEGECDLDVSAVLMDGNGRDMEAVFFGRLESEEHGIQHTGDNLTGEGDGDDEQILVNLDQVGAAVQQIFFVVNIYTPQKTFRQVAEPFCRVIDNASGSELCRYALRDAGDESGLIIARISREAGDRWGFHALGLPCRGRTYKDSVSQLRAACNVKTASLMLRSQSSGSNLGAAVSEVALPPPFQRTSHDQKCCIVM